MILETCELKQDYEVLGLVKGSRVRAVNALNDMTSALKNIIGGELGSYSKLLKETRDAVMDDMIKEAKALGADATIAVRFTSSQVAQGSAEIVVYGTAIKLKG
ncbi:hypothetical protein Nther_0999 [Calderihabitans maritimus]|uniref:UPF0145 protein KKC1_16190 n=2 Tax=Calderihabitans maritimus TaxID=1246530 RepID=A0A1Z5HT32_9FIRM|nr:hypothetical protein Nther_0999 [Calderihabitans maritimus]